MLKSILWWFTIIYIMFFNIQKIWFNENKYSNNYSNKVKQQHIPNIKVKHSLIWKKVKKIFLNKLVKDALLHIHWTGIKQQTLKKLCSYYNKYCNIIDISKNEFNLTQQTYYITLTIYLLNYLSKSFPDITKKLYYIKIQKDKIWRRWYAWHHSLEINLKKWIWYEQFLEVLTHELWHVVDLWLINWKSNIKNQNYTEFWQKSFSIDDKSIIFYKLSWKSEKIKRPYIYAKDFVSGYWLTDIFEDFAESFNMYVNHNTVFRKMAKESNILHKKYLFINNIMKWKYLQSDKNFNYKIWYRPRDSTTMDN